MPYCVSEWSSSRESLLLEMTISFCSDHAARKDGRRATEGGAAFAKATAPEGRTTGDGASSNNQEPITGNHIFAQEGASVAETATGFTVTVTARTPGKPQRVEVEIPWPEAVAFGADDFLDFDFRLRP